MQKPSLHLQGSLKAINSVHNNTYQCHITNCLTNQCTNTNQIANRGEEMCEVVDVGVMAAEQEAECHTNNSLCGATKDKCISHSYNKIKCMDNMCRITVQTPTSTSRTGITAGHEGTTYQTGI